jgi:hypothetical protein
MIIRPQVSTGIGVAQALCVFLRAEITMLSQEISASFVWKVLQSRGGVSLDSEYERAKLRTKEQSETNRF